MTPCNKWKHYLRWPRDSISLEIFQGKFLRRSSRALFSSDWKDINVWISLSYSLETSASQKHSVHLKTLTRKDYLIHSNSSGNMQLLQVSGPWSPATVTQKSMYCFCIQVAILASFTYNSLYVIALIIFQFSEPICGEARNVPRNTQWVRNHSSTKNGDDFSLVISYSKRLSGNHGITTRL